ncbi:hypothetical protein B7P43_G09759, partial [Cryptotermes secundus]
RSEWPRGLRHEPSTSAWTLGSWVRIPLEALIYVLLFCSCVVLYAGSGLVTGRSPVQGVLTTVYEFKLQNHHSRKSLSMSMSMSMSMSLSVSMSMSMSVGMNMSMSMSMNMSMSMSIRVSMSMSVSMSVSMSMSMSTRSET